MNDCKIGASASMLGSAQDIQANSINKLMQSGAAAASAGMASGNDDGGQMRTQAMQAQGIGKNLDITA